MKLVCSSPYTITINIVWKKQIALMIKHQIFVNMHLPLQTKIIIIKISKRYSICSNLLIRYYSNASDVIIVFLLSHQIKLNVFYKSRCLFLNKVAGVILEQGVIL